MTLSELRKELKLRGEDTNGTTKELRDRLERSLMKEMKEKQEKEKEQEETTKTNNKKTIKRKTIEDDDSDKKIAGLETLLNNDKPIDVGITLIPNSKTTNTNSQIRTYSKKQKLATNK